MDTTEFGVADLRRVAVIGCATVALLVGAAFAKPFYSATTAANGAWTVAAAGQEAKTEKAAFVTSPTLEADPQFLFGCNDGSNGYYAQQAEGTH